MTDEDLESNRNAESLSSFLDVLERKLSEEDSSSLDVPVTAAELAQSIRTMNPHKSPGIDGFPACFYQLDAPLFGEILRIVFNDQGRKGILLDFQRWSAISLLFKGGDRRNPANYRPIALIPVEVKALSRALAYRLSHVLPSIVQPEQNGFVKGRRIHDHVVFLQDLQHYCTTFSEEAYAMF
ncbi:hypothetical protein AeRB84_008391, partial [Aphanomyces euteiches]